MTFRAQMIQPKGFSVSYRKKTVAVEDGGGGGGDDDEDGVSSFSFEKPPLEISSVCLVEFSFPSFLMGC